MKYKNAPVIKANYPTFHILAAVFRRETHAHSRNIHKPLNIQFSSLHFSCADGKITLKFKVVRAREGEEDISPAPNPILNV